MNEKYKIRVTLDLTVSSYDYQNKETLLDEISTEGDFTSLVQSVTTDNVEVHNVEFIDAQLK